jgi:hypothetical protein
MTPTIQGQNSSRSDPMTSASRNGFFRSSTVAIASALVWFLSAVPLSAQANPNQVALLHWYTANTVTQFPTQTQPFGTLFDGTNIWVANSGSSSLSKYRPSDGALLATYALGHPAQY